MSKKYTRVIRPGSEIDRRSSPVFITFWSVSIRRRAATEVNLNRRRQTTLLRFDQSLLYHLETVRYNYNYIQLLSSVHTDGIRHIIFIWFYVVMYYVWIRSAFELSTIGPSIQRSKTAFRKLFLFLRDNKNDRGPLNANKN
jgi:hypothetical protein